MVRDSFFHLDVKRGFENTHKKIQKTLLVLKGQLFPFANLALWTL